MQSSKGISPLVAAVLLIAVTMTIAGVLAYWATTFVRTQTAAFQNESIASACSFANLAAHSCSYNTNASQINLILDNIGRIELRDMVVQVIYENNSVSDHSLNGTLPGNLLRSYTFTGVSSDYRSVVVKTNCPTATVELACR